MPGPDHSREIRVPALGLVVLVGVSGSGKSTFARQHFAPTQVVSSDACRAMVSDDENDQTATPDAFSVLNFIVGTRLRRGLLTVVDATSVQRSARKALIDLARENDVLVDAIVLDVPPEEAIARNLERTDRDWTSDAATVVTRQDRDLRRSLKGLRKEGFRRVHFLTPDDLASPDAVTITTEPSWNDRRDLTGPFDLFGDVHGCLTELVALLTKLGWEIAYNDAGQPIGASHPEGRTAVFVGDLVDRGPDTPGVLRLVMGMTEAGHALSVSGNHEAKLVRALKGAKVQLTHGLGESLEQIAAAGPEFSAQALSWMDKLIAHYVLDGGNLVVAHAGLKEAYHGRSSARVRSFALYGDVTGESDEYGLPIRLPWAREYRGQAAVVYGHIPSAEAEWVNNTICLDTGVVFGGKLTALRYPERELVDVPAAQRYADSIRPLALSQDKDRAPGVLQISDVLDTHWLETEQGGRVKIPAENAAAALEVMSRFAVDPRWLLYLPPTMSPTKTSTLDGFLEHPAEAFGEFAAAGITEVVCEEKHMGSRAIAVVARDAEAARRRFNMDGVSAGMVYTRTGRAFFTGDDADVLVKRLRTAVAPLFDELNTDWLALDCELLPWSAKALPLIQEQYASVGAAAGAALPAAEALLRQAQERGLDVADLLARTEHRDSNAAAFRDAYRAYVHPATSAADVTLAPFQILAGEGEAYAITRDHRWHLNQIGRLTDPLITPTRHRFVDLSDPSARAAATDWWLELTAAGGEGMVVKPVDPAQRLATKAQPGLKVRGREYLRIIYGPDYLDSLPLLRNRSLNRKRSLASREHGLGLEALAKFTQNAPLWQVHQYVFGVLALESEAVDPRL